MPDAFTVFPILLIPLALILFMTRNFGKVLRYPLDLLARDDGPRIARLLFRTLRSRYDLLFDVAIALVLSFAVVDTGSSLLASGSGAGQGKKAVVIDCSRSMFAGEPGARPIDRALQALSTRPALAASDRFALVFDAASARSLLVSWSSIAGTSRDREEADRVLASSPPFAVDYRALSALPGKGYRDITLVTDRFPMRARGFSVLETGFVGGTPDDAAGSLTGLAWPDAEAPRCWPAAIRTDRSGGSWVADFVEAGRRTALSIQARDEASGSFLDVAPTRYSIQERPEGRSLRLAEPGTYRFVFDDPASGIPIVFTAVLGPAEIAAWAKGSFSELMREALPYLVALPRPSVALADGGEEAAARATKAPHVIITTIVGADPLVADPGLLGGRPLAAANVKAGGFAWGPASLANPDLPLAYDAELRRAAKPTFVTAFPSKGRRMASPWGSWLVASDEGPIAVNAPESEYFAPEASGSLELSTEPHVWLWAVLLALPAIAKLLVWRLLSRGSGAAGTIAEPREPTGPSRSKPA